MKTGRDANRSGLYVSECCLKEVPFLKGQMFSRCPRCSALTVWEFVKQTELAQGFPADLILKLEDTEFDTQEIFRSLHGFPIARG